MHKYVYSRTAAASKHGWLTQSFSTETRFNIEHNFSTQAKNVTTARSPVLAIEGSGISMASI
jgi:hypothetical protein